MFEPVGALELKGLDEPVEACRVVWSPIDPSTTRPPLPAGLRRRCRRRSSAVGMSTTAVDGVEGGRGRWAGRLMLLAGEPGIGKTTLAARFASEVYDQDGFVVYGRSDEDLGVPYQPWIEALTQLVAQHRNRCWLRMSRLGARISRASCPNVATRAASRCRRARDADAERFVLFGCVIDLLARVSAVQPVLVVLDDLHWADRATVQLLRHVATAEQPMRRRCVGDVPRLRGRVPTIRCRSCWRRCIVRAAPCGLRCAG